MKRTTFLRRGLALALCAFLGALAPGAHAADLTLFELGMHIDGTTHVDMSPTAALLPGSVDSSGFDFATGLGSITTTITGTGVHNVILYVDHEIDESINTYFNETGATFGDPGAVSDGTLSWEIDEPGWVDGDIYDNLHDGFLDNTIGEGYDITTFPDDVSMGLGWEFELEAGEEATIDFVLSLAEPTGGFYVTHSDPDSDVTIYFTSSLDITGGLPDPNPGPGGGPNPSPIPEPTTIALFGAGAIAAAARRRRQRRNA